MAHIIIIFYPMRLAMPYMNQMNVKEFRNWRKKKMKEVEIDFMKMEKVYMKKKIEVGGETVFWMTLSGITENLVVYGQVDSHLFLDFIQV